MSNIRYICVSDLHLGADNSLLTQLGSKPGEVDPSKPSEVLTALVNCLRQLLRHNKNGSKPTLILNGDALELALAEDNVALMAFERFLELMFPLEGEPLIRPLIIFNPGNHDHHLWETARETQYVDFLEDKRSKKPGWQLPPPWHTTKMFKPDLVDSRMLNAVICRHANMTSQGVHVGTVYPNLCVMHDDVNKSVIFTHGHYIESIYMLMTALGNFVFPKRRLPTQIWDIETENFAWIDFFWSAMGRSGDVGRDIEQIYDMLLVSEARHRLVRKLARAAGHRWLRRAPKLGEWLGLLSVPLFSNLLNRAGGLEKTQSGEVLTVDARQGLKAYVEGPLTSQIMKERNCLMQVPTTLIFGHTHKPFSASINYEHFPRNMNVYNSGGWVVDTEVTEKRHGGAIVLIDEQLNTVSVRMYNEAKTPHDYQVKVEAVDSSSNSLCASLAAVVKHDEAPWSSFSHAVAHNVERYHDRFRDRLKLVK